MQGNDQVAGACKVTFDISLGKIHYEPKPKQTPGHYEPLKVKESWSRAGEVTEENFPFIPFPGLHLGDWQIVNVCQVYYLGLEDGKPVFHCNCEHVSDPQYYGGDTDGATESWKTIEEMEREIIARTKMNWTFREES